MENGSLRHRCSGDIGFYMYGPTIARLAATSVMLYPEATSVAIDVCGDDDTGTRLLTWSLAAVLRRRLEEL